MTLSLTLFVGVIATILTLSAYLQKNVTWVKIQIGLGSLGWGLHYVMLGDMGIAAIQTSMAGRSFLSIYTRTLPQKHILFWVSSIVFAIASYYAWEGWTTGLSLAAAINNSAALAYRSNKTMRLQMMVSSLMWVAIGLITGSWPAIASSVVSVLFGAITWVRLHRTPYNEIQAKDKSTQNIQITV